MGIQNLGHPHGGRQWDMRDPVERSEQGCRNGLSSFQVGASPEQELSALPRMGLFQFAWVHHRDIFLGRLRSERWTFAEPSLACGGNHEL